MIIAMDDLDLVEAVRNGELEAFTALVEKYQGRIYRLAFRILKHVADAEDVTQETFIQAFRALDNFRADSTFFTWLYRIALNNALNARQRQRQFSVRFDPAGDDIWQAMECLHPVSFDDTPPDCLERKQTLETVERVLNEMPEKFADALLLLVLDGLTCTEISSLSAVSPNTVRTRVFRARELLARRMPDFHITVRSAL